MTTPVSLAGLRAGGRSKTRTASTFVPGGRAAGRAVDTRSGLCVPPRSSVRVTAAVSPSGTSSPPVLISVSGTVQNRPFTGVAFP